MSVVGLLGGLGMGFVLSVLGAGGTLFIVPVLVFAVGMPVAEATGTSLGGVFAGSLVGAFGHWRKGNLIPRAVLLFGGASMAGAVAGAGLHPLVSDRLLLTLFAGILFVAAGRMAWGSHEPRHPDRPPRAVVLLPLGAAIGVLSGFLGVGGGFLIVPALSWGAGLSVRHAIGTSLAVIALSSFTGAVSHAVQGQVSGAMLASVGCGAIIGGLIGAPLSGKIPERPLRMTFATLMLGLGIYMSVRVAQGG